MVHLVKKRKRGFVYLYLEERAWIEGKSKRLWQIYLGPEHELKDRGKLLTGKEVETETVEFGLIAALLSIAKKLELVKIINAHTDKRAQALSVGEHLLFAAINRCVEPVSKRQLMDWFKNSLLYKIYPKVASALDSRSYWTHFRYLNDANIDAMGEELARATMRYYNVSFKELLFDPTNFFTYIHPKKANQTLPRHGKSKDGRNTLNLINLSLFCAMDGGIPFLQMVYPGNEQDASHFKTALRRLQQRLKRMEVPSSTVTLIFDKGNLSKEAFEYIDKEKYQYICSIRPSTQKELLSLAANEFTMGTLPNGKSIGTKGFIRSIYEKERRIIALYNPKQAQWLLKNYEQKLEARMGELRSFFKTRLNTERWKDPEKIRKKCSTVLGAAKFQNAVTLTLQETEGKLLLSLAKDEKGFQAHAMRLGKSFLMTNCGEVPDFEVAWAYRQQYLVENAFKLLKNPKCLSLRPMFARVDTSTRGHSFTCFLGLLLLTLLVREVLARDIPMSIPKAIHCLSRIKITKITIPGKKQPTYKLNKMDELSKRVYGALHLEQYA